MATFIISETQGIMRRNAFVKINIHRTHKNQCQKSTFIKSCKGGSPEPVEGVRKNLPRGVARTWLCALEGGGVRQDLSRKPTTSK